MINLKKTLLCGAATSLLVATPAIAQEQTSA